MNFIHDSELPSELCDRPECQEHHRMSPLRNRVEHARRANPDDSWAQQYAEDLPPVLDRVEALEKAMRALGGMSDRGTPDPTPLTTCVHSVPLVVHVRVPNHHADQPCTARQEDRTPRLCTDDGSWREAAPDPTPLTAESRTAHFYIVGVLAAFMEQRDPRTQKILDSLDKELRKVEQATEQRARSALQPDTFEDGSFNPFGPTAQHAIGFREGYELAEKRAKEQGSALQPVVDAALAWRDRASSDFPEGWYRLCEAVDAYREAGKP